MIKLDFLPPLVEKNGPRAPNKLHANNKMMAVDRYVPFPLLTTFSEQRHRRFEHESSQRRCHVPTGGVARDHRQQPYCNHPVEGEQRSNENRTRHDKPSHRATRRPPLRPFRRACEPRSPETGSSFSDRKEFRRFVQTATLSIVGGGLLETMAPEVNACYSVYGSSCR